MMRQVGAATLLALLFSSFGCLKPPLALKREGHGIEVNVSTLGEYPSSISRIQLRDLQTESIVWEVRAKGKVPQIWKVSLAPGLNSSTLASVLNGHYDVVVPRSSISFRLYRGRPYEISIWNEAGSRKQEARFVL
jgi:hypothetical protein